MQQHYATAMPQVPQIRATGLGPYTSLAVAGSPMPQQLECKAATVIPAVAAASRQPLIAGRITHAQPVQSVQPQVVPAVIAAPLPQQQQHVNSKIQPQLQNLPRFRPPSFEGPLPCPESPGSTPRSDTAVGCSAGREAAEPPFPPGSVVEYKSRSAGHWIAAKVEYFDEVKHMYRLDVHPHAAPDRVRVRGAGTYIRGTFASSLGPGDQAFVPEQPEALHTGVARPVGTVQATSVSMPSAVALPTSTVGPLPTGGALPIGAPLSSGGPVPIALSAPAAGAISSSAPLPSTVLPTPVAVGLRIGAQTAESTGGSCSGVCENEGTTFDETPSVPLGQLLSTPPRPIGTSGDHVCAMDDPQAMPQDVNSLMEEVTRLRDMVRNLEAENCQLLEQVAQEAMLKDRYFQELRMCHDQLQNVPRARVLVDEQNEKGF
eukprot:TRINITY_DN20907_c0_g1_i1.p1 TRINITY_DN20907_c0_g1~~TRINITY_DN20907_c0_g1_i1.p1  ORF type:complete len:431 (-),score=80.42 TRINITY_DN20907_c0_g1_i1:169-1461(-)